MCQQLPQSVKIRKMKKLKSLLFVFLYAAVLSNCTPARKDFISLPEKVQKELGTTEVYLVECDKQMKADIESSNLGVRTGGHLFFALLDCVVIAHRKGCADDALVAIQKEIQAFNFQEKFRDKFVRALQSTPWLHTSHINYVTSLNDETLEEILKKENRDGILVSKFIYKLNPQFNVLTGTLYLTLYPTSNKIKKMVNAEDSFNTPIFKFHISATEALPQQAETDMEENAKIWAQDNGSYLKRSLENIIYQILINLDKILKNPNHLTED